MTAVRRAVHHPVTTIAPPPSPVETQIREVVFFGTPDLAGTAA
jgi:hypothetical protein